MKIIGKNTTGIYCIQNIVSSKIYIGSSSNIERRLYKHRSLLRNSKHENVIMTNSWNKNGEKCFVTSIIEECSADELLVREQFWIDKLKPYFNITKKVLRNELSESSRRKISKTLKEGYKTGRIKSKSLSPVDVYDKKLKLIHQFNSIKKASIELGVCETLIGRVLNGAYKTGKGFIFTYKGDKPIKVNMSKAGTELIFTKDDETLRFKSFAEAGRFFDVYSSTIHSSFKRKGSYKEYIISRA